MCLWVSYVRHPQCTTQLNCLFVLPFLNGHRFQGMDEMKRLSGDHQVWDPEWETAFNIQLRMQEILGMIIAWASSDVGNIFTLIV